MSGKILSSTVSIFFNYLLYAYVEKLESIDCKCSETFRRGSIKGYILTNYVLICGFLIFNQQVPPLVLLLIGMYTIIGAFNTFMYVRYLKNSNCKCSESILREIYYYYYFIVFVLYAIIIGIFALLFLMSSIKIN
jgi:hypothetical protein